jgi:hypothetical protein
MSVNEPRRGLNMAEPSGWTSLAKTATAPSGVGDPRRMAEQDLEEKLAEQADRVAQLLREGGESEAVERELAALGLVLRALARAGGAGRERRPARARVGARPSRGSRGFCDRTPIGEVTGSTTGGVKCPTSRTST